MRTAILPAGNRQKKSKKREGGFTYVMILVAVAVLGIVVETGTVVTSRLLQAERELELIFRGQAYTNAIKSYYDAGATAGRGKTFPRTLDELLLDPRFANKRHLRVLYPDPMVKGKEWALIRAPDGGIAGVASTSTQTPLKKANFPKGLETFAGARAYTDWIFEFKPRAISPAPAPVPGQPIAPPVMHTN